MMGAPIPHANHPPGHRSPRSPRTTPPPSTTPSPPLKRQHHHKLESEEGQELEDDGNDMQGEQFGHEQETAEMLELQDILAREEEQEAAAAAAAAATTAGPATPPLPPPPPPPPPAPPRPMPAPATAFHFMSSPTQMTMQQVAQAALDEAQAQEEEEEEQQQQQNNIGAVSSKAQMDAVSSATTSSMSLPSVAAFAARTAAAAADDDDDDDVQFMQQDPPSAAAAVAAAAAAAAAGAQQHQPQPLVQPAAPQQQQAPQQAAAAAAVHQPENPRDAVFKMVRDTGKQGWIAFGADIAQWSFHTIAPCQPDAFSLSRLCPPDVLTDEDRAYHGDTGPLQLLVKEIVNEQTKLFIDSLIEVKVAVDLAMALEFTKQKPLPSQPPPSVARLAASVSGDRNAQDAAIAAARATTAKAIQQLQRLAAKKEARVDAFLQNTTLKPPVTAAILGAAQQQARILLANKTMRRNMRPVLQAATSAAANRRQRHNDNHNKQSHQNSQHFDP
jgi:hypothetical protein